MRPDTRSTKRSVRTTTCLGGLVVCALCGCGDDDATGGAGGMGGASGSTSHASTAAVTSSHASSTSVASSSGSGGAPCQLPTGGAPVATKVIVFVWDGLRPDSVNATDTPNLAAMRAAGSEMADNHATYPTFTMMNAASFATGAFPGTTGFYGNTLWAPGASGADSALVPVDFRQPAFVEDYAILKDLDAYYGNQLLLVGTLFEAAQQAGLKTATVGKSGSAFLQDRKEGGLVLDERMAYPQAFAEALQGAGFPLPKLTPNAYPAGTVTLAADNGDPTAQLAKKVLGDNVTTDPTDTTGNTPGPANAYLMNAYANYVLPEESPDVTLVWLRNPDSTEHAYGPGTANYRDALHSQDALLGQLQTKLADLGLTASTDLIIVSDHAHSSVSGPFELFPLRAVAGGAVGAVDANGYSVSGDVRMADLLTKAGFVAYDGSGCVYDPTISGIRADGSPLIPTSVDTDGTICGGVLGKLYTTPSYRVPAEPLPAKAVVVAANGGSDYLYVPDHDPATVAALVTFCRHAKRWAGSSSRRPMVRSTAPFLSTR